jgi:hypothetical protein
MKLINWAFSKLDRNNQGKVGNYFDFGFDLGIDF